jgi:NADH-quinone oxidoreductase subunit N
VLNAAAAAFYYLRVAVYMYMRDPASDAEPLRHGRMLWAGLAVATVLTIVVGLFPTPIYESAGDAAQALPQEVTRASN